MEKLEIQKLTEEIAGKMPQFEPIVKVECPFQKTLFSNISLENARRLILARREYCVFFFESENALRMFMQEIEQNAQYIFSMTYMV